MLRFSVANVAGVLTSSILLVSAAHQNPLVLTQPKVVDLGYAQYQSDLSLTEGVTSFLGVRYAAPATGPLRWRKPRLPDSILELQNATTAPDACFQAHLVGAMGTSLKNPLRKAASPVQKRTFRSKQSKTRNRRIQRKRTIKREDVGKLSEDCLFLNVHVPTDRQSESLLPVTVYIHGGAYDAGNATVYPVQDLVKASNYSLVSVSIQYRLGIFGFLSGKEVKDDGDLNVGLLDQNFALQWVQRHISAFGGDPNKVSIWGQSAGAGSMLQHVVAHAGNTQPPLFRAVLMNSPFLPPQYNYDDSITESLFKRVVSHVNCVDSEDTLACLRSTPASEIQDADNTIGAAGFLGTYSFLPVVDGEFIVERPSVTLQRGRVNGGTLFVTSNANEGGFFVPSDVIESKDVSLTSWITEMFPRFKQDHVERTAELYSDAGGTVAEKAAAIMGDVIFVCPALWTVMAFGKQGYKAKFAIPPAYHADDLAYEFSDFLPRIFPDPDFFKAWQQSHLSVALSLDPNSHFDPTNITPEWPTWANVHSEMLFNKTENDTPIIEAVRTSEEQSARCTYWAGLAPIVSQ